MQLFVFILHCFACLFAAFYNYWVGSYLLERLSAVLYFQRKMTKLKEKQPHHQPAVVMDR